MSADLDARTFEEAAAGRVGADIGHADMEALRASFDLIRASTRLVQHLERHVHRPAGWSMAGFRVMFCVWVAGELEPREIARLSGLSRAAVSSVLNTLERDGLVRRYRESADRRLVTVRLTAEGERGVRQAYAEQNEQERAFFDALSPTQLSDLTDTLRAMLEHRLPEPYDVPG